MQFEKVYQYINDKLNTGLPSYIVYHTAAHTNSVINAAGELANEENITGDDLVLLKTAALFHDAGFLQHHLVHEELSIRMARKILPDFGYDDTQIDIVCRMIMATRIPQSPTDKLAEILCDADLYYIGTTQYAAIAQKLYEENSKTTESITKTEWLMRQISFLSSHRFHTKSAREKLNEQKKRNLEILQAEIQANTKHKTSSLQIVFDGLQAAIGIAIAAGALNLFLVPNHFFDGGITGISLLTHEIYGYNLGLIIPLFNLPLIILSYFIVNKGFALRTFMCVLMLGILLQIMPTRVATEDKLLISIFGGAFLGIGIGLIMRLGAALDGIEVLALYTIKKTSFTISEVILAINILIFSVAAFNFGIETALYSILTYFTATRCIDYVVEGLQAYTGVTIVSAKSDVIKYQLVNQLGRGITVYKGERGYLPGSYDISNDCDIVFTIITRLEFRKLRNVVYDIDPQAFVFTHVIKETTGGLVKRRKH